MGVAIKKSAIDLGIVTTNGDAMLAFYRDTLGFTYERQIPMPIGDGIMHRMDCGESLIKLVGIAFCQGEVGAWGHWRCHRLPLLDHHGKQSGRDRPGLRESRPPDRNRAARGAPRRAYRHGRGPGWQLGGVPVCRLK